MKINYIKCAKYRVTISIPFGLNCKNVKYYLNKPDQKIDFINLQLNFICKIMKEKGCLSKRERQVLQMISRGMTSKQISQELFSSVTTVNTHRRNLLRKSNTKNVAELICFGFNTSCIS